MGNLTNLKGISLRGCDLENPPATVILEVTSPAVHLIFPTLSPPPPTVILYPASSTLNPQPLLCVEA